MTKTHKIKLGALVILLIVAIFSAYLALKTSSNTLVVAFLNVGQGDAIFINSPSGNQMLVDGGSGRQILGELGRVMHFYDKNIDIVLATHPDMDHIGGLNDVFDKYKIDLFVEPGVESDSSIYQELKKRVGIEKYNYIEARRGMTIDFGDGVFFEILFPVFDPKNIETNNASIVGKLIYGQNEFLLTGDSPQKIEEYLVSLEKNKCQGSTLPCFGRLESDVLKAGHHGSKTSTSQAFVSAVSPQYTVISVGKDNKYGHPNQEILDILNNFGTKILRTDKQGMIIFTSNGTELILKN